MKRSYIAGLLVLIAAVVLMVLWLQYGGSDGLDTSSENLPEEDPLSIVLDFYNSWLDAVNSTSSNPYDAGLARSEMLSTEVQQYISEHRDDELDHVLCQPMTPPRIGARMLYWKDTSAQAQVLARGLTERSPHTAVVTLAVVEGEWNITKIECSSGESGPSGEFSFEKEGQLLKSVPEPLNSDYWHLVFTENGTPGHTVPLFFDENSMCTNSEGETSVCNEDEFTQTTEVTVKGEMTESGVEVREIIY